MKDEGRTPHEHGWNAKARERREEMLICWSVSQSASREATGLFISTFAVEEFWRFVFDAVGDELSSEHIGCSDLAECIANFSFSKSRQQYRV